MAIACCFASLLMTGCLAHGDDRANRDTPIGFEQRIQEAILAAQEGGASEEQLILLEQASEVGEVNFDAARQAALSWVECVEEAGGTAEYHELTEPSGLVLPATRILADDEEALAKIEPAAESCLYSESYWVNQVYQLQPSSQVIRDTHLATIAPSIRECLEVNGYSTDPRATPDDLLSQASRVWQETDGAVSCYEGR